jgi:transposase
LGFIFGDRETLHQTLTEDPPPYHLIDHELDLSLFDARFRNDQTGAKAYDPRILLKIVLYAYSRKEW